LEALFCVFGVFRSTAFLLFLAGTEQHRRIFVHLAVILGDGNFSIGEHVEMLALLPLFVDSIQFFFLTNCESLDDHADAIGVEEIKAGDAFDD
jgi:hypothetical protein